MGFFLQDTVRYCCEINKEIHVYLGWNCTLRKILMQVKPCLYILPCWRETKGFVYTFRKLSYWYKQRDLSNLADNKFLTEIKKKKKILWEGKKINLFIYLLIYLFSVAGRERCPRVKSLNCISDQNRRDCHTRTHITLQNGKKCPGCKVCIRPGKKRVKRAMICRKGV